MIGTKIIEKLKEQNRKNATRDILIAWSNSLLKMKVEDTSLIKIIFIIFIDWNLNKLQLGIKGLFIDRPCAIQENKSPKLIVQITREIKYYLNEKKFKKN